MLALPDKPSELLALAIADMKLCEADPRYTIDMRNWHTLNHNGICEVCLAGSVMAKTLNYNFGIDLNLFEIETETDPDLIIHNKLWALNYLREGYVLRAMQMLNLEYDFLRSDFNNPLQYNEESGEYINENAYNLKAFYYDMELLIAELERIGY